MVKFERTYIDVFLVVYNSHVYGHSCCEHLHKDVGGDIINDSVITYISIGNQIDDDHDDETNNMTSYNLSLTRLMKALSLHSEWLPWEII